LTAFFWVCKSDCMFKLEPAVIAALITGLIALLGLIISKESKVSEFRQQWIDSLREDVSAVIAHAEGIRRSCISASIGPPADAGRQSLWDTVRDDMAGIKKKSATIRLRLNPNEKRKNEKEANNLILSALKRYREVFDSSDTRLVGVDEVNEQLISATQTVLKENWNRVRRGERVYRITRWLAGLFVLGVLIYLLFNTVTINF